MFRRTVIRFNAVALSSSDPLNAYAYVQQYRKSQKLIPPAIMAKLYELAQHSFDPLHTHLFKELVTVDQVGQQHFLVNFERVIKLQLAQHNYEACIAFIREVELANRGDVVLSYDTLESLVLAAKWHGDAEIAMQAIRILSDAYPSVYARTWGLAFQTVLDAGDYNSLKWIYKSALIPGLLVVDDASYLRMAAIAAQHGDLKMCEWSSLRMRRRQRALQLNSRGESLQLYVYLIEAAASSSVLNTTDKLAASFQAVCRYLVRLGPLAGQVSVRDLPYTVQAIVRNEESLVQISDLFDSMCGDAAVCKEAKTIVFNLILSAHLTGALDADRALQISQTARSAGVEFNEDSILLLLELAYRGGSGSRVYEGLVMQYPTPKVIRRARMLKDMQNDPVTS